MSLFWLAEMTPAARLYILVVGVVLFSLLTMLEIQHRKEQRQKTLKAQAASESSDMSRKQ